MKIFKRILKILSIVLIVLFFIVGGYVGYVFMHYSRIPDNTELTPKNIGKDEKLKADKEYSIMSYNIGFGAYCQDFTFFMDGGKESWARSKDSVIDLVNGASNKVKEYDPDFILYQEVDFDSDRSYHVNEEDLLIENHKNYSSVAAINYHSPFLMYPFYKPHGASNSELLTMSKYNITSAKRRSFEISKSLSRFLDLDRCYSVSRIPLENGKEIVLYNNHMSAYGGNEQIRKSQTTMLFEDMQSEYEKGNYCICGGDFNHDFTGDSTQVLNGTKEDTYDWAKPFPIDTLKQYEGLIHCINYTNGEYVPTCRNCDIPYKVGNETFIVDGFLVSKNVNVTYLENISTDFVYSDHNPVLLKFKLN